MLVFDKTLDQSWAVPWHRDTTITVAERHEVEGFGPWSIKGCLHHVRPAPEVLRGMAPLQWTAATV
ncbi:MAG: hypothetical protein AAGB51_08825 [Planctomycetota bacterium]